MDILSFWKTSTCFCLPDSVFNSKHCVLTCTRLMVCRRTTTIRTPNCPFFNKKMGSLGRLSLQRLRRIPRQSRFVLEAATRKSLIGQWSPIENRFMDKAHEYADWRQRGPHTTLDSIFMTLWLVPPDWLHNDFQIDGKYRKRDHSYQVPLNEERQIKTHPF